MKRIVTCIAILFCTMDISIGAEVNKTHRQVRADAPVGTVGHAPGDRHRMNEAHRPVGPGVTVRVVPGREIGHAPRDRHRERRAAGGGGYLWSKHMQGAYLWSRHMQLQREEMERATRGTGVTIIRTGDNRLMLAIPNDISFDTNRYDIKPAMMPILNRLAVSLRRNPATRVAIVGHTDSTGSDEINDPLSVDRAAATRSYLQARGVPSKRIAIDGRGSYEPIADNDTVEGRAMNRRVEIYVAEARWRR